VLTAQLKITWEKSCIGKPQSQRRIIRSLGLRRLHHSVVHMDTPTIRGMVNKVIHLIAVEKLEATG
jgi:large subunit ribosomal protein L30